MKVGLVTAISLCVFSFMSCKSANTKLEQLKLMATDKEWSAAIADGDIDKIASFWTEDAILYFPGAPIVIGKGSIKDIVIKNRAISGFSFEHKPAEVFVSSSGDFGYTTGTFNLSSPGKEGELLKREGNYVSIWNKQKDGSWKCSINIGNYRSSIVKEAE
jgi:ketosteroid isomerase-like protein